jgi:glutaminase
VLERLTVDDTGLRATPVMALDLHNRDSRNPMVNAGALATTVVVPSATPVAKRAVDISTNGCVDVPHAGPGVAQDENATMGHAPTSVVDADQRADR